MFLIIKNIQISNEEKKSQNTSRRSFGYRSFKEKTFLKVIEKRKDLSASIYYYRNGSFNDASSSYFGYGRNE